MSKTKIEWADQVWNPVTGCTPISEGCLNCYAARMAKRLAGRYGYTKGNPFQPGTFHPNKLDEPYHWKKPQKIFVCSMGDLFHEDVRQRSIVAIFDIGYRAYITYGHTFIFLTKRPQRMNDEIILWSHVRGIDMAKLDGFWLGVTTENQRTADERIPILLQIPAAKHFVSVEPMLEPVDLTHFFDHRWPLLRLNALTGKYLFDTHAFTEDTEGHKLPETKLDWVIAGPETGPGARPYNIDWVRDLQRQCAAAGVPFFDKKDALGETIQEWPR